MGKMKLFSVSGVALLLMVSLAGCGSGGAGGKGAVSTPTDSSTSSTGSAGSATTKSVVLAWGPPTNTNGTSVAGYKVYYGTSSGNYAKSVNTGTATTYTVSGLSSGTYYFNVTDYDTSGNESSFANEVSATIQ